MRYAIVIEQAGNGYSAYVPDLPGCIATAATKAEVEHLIHDAIELHLAGLREDGAAVPPPSSQVEYIEVAASWPRRPPPPIPYAPSPTRKKGVRFIYPLHAGGRAVSGSRSAG